MDSNILGPTVNLLQTLFLHHEFTTTASLGLEDAEDIELFRAAAGAGFDALVTKDRNQWRDLDERRELDASGLHWIGHRSKDISGLLGLSLQTATICAGMAHVLNDWRTEPHIYLLTGVEALAKQRVKVVQTRLASER